MAARAHAAPRAAAFPIGSRATFFVLFLSLAPPAAAAPCAARGAPSFLEAGLAAGVDKVAVLDAPHGADGHHYAPAYEKYLAPLQATTPRLLEIGLGCDSWYGPGRSVALWRAYLPCAHVSVVEVDAACAARASVADVTYVLDQGDEAAMRALGAGGAPYDVIIDDGSHVMSHQQASLRALWPALAPGGAYFLEDLSTSFVDGYIDSLPTTWDVVASIQRIRLFPQAEGQRRAGVRLPSGVPRWVRDIARSVESVDCFEELCVLKKSAAASATAQF
jgi:hypothetical protein